MISLTSFPSLPVMNLKELMRSSSPLFTLKILLSGATGKMGHMIFDTLKNSKEHQIVAGYAAELDPDLPFPIYLNLNECQEKESIDLIIDFSSPNSIDHLLDFALENKIAMVIASTGFSNEQEDRIKKAADDIPILHSKNMSLGVNVMQILVEKMADRKSVV